jgi:hypothetical protein
MVAHMTAKELEFITKLKSKKMGTPQIHKRLAAQRARRGEELPDITAIRRFLAGTTHKRGAKETRGRKRTYSPANVRTMNKVRKDLYMKGKKKVEVHWQDVITKARVPQAHPSTAAKAFKREGLDVRARHPREKPSKDEKAEEERMVVAGGCRYRPETFFTEEVDGFFDNKRWDVPTYTKAKDFLKQKKVRFHLRTRAEGLHKDFTKPNSKKHKQNPGASLNVCAGIIGNRVRVWHYLPQRWSGEAAADLYRGPIIKALKRYRGQKAHYKILEDNDATGYKSNKGKAAKQELKIRPLKFPRYSPDLNPLDFALWSEVERRMGKHKVSGNESVSKFKARLRRTAMNIPATVIKKMTASIKKRAKAGEIDYPEFIFHNFGYAGRLP